MQQKFSMKFYNLGSFIGLSLWLVLAFIILCFQTNDMQLLGLAAAGFVLLVYLLSVFFLSYYIFDALSYKKIYPTRFKKAKELINYEQVKKVSYINKYISRHNPPKAVIEYKAGSQMQKHFLVIRSKKKCSKLLKFFQSKGISVKIKSNNKKDKQLLE